MIARFCLIKYNFPLKRNIQVASEQKEDNIAILLAFCRKIGAL